MTSRWARRVGATGALLSFLTLTACSDSGEGGRVTGEAGYVGSDDPTVLVVPAEDRRPAPDLAGQLVGGGAYSLSEVRGDDIVVVNVWGSWCSPCRAEAATLEAVYQDLRDDGVQFLGLNTRDNEKAALAFLERFQISYPNLDDTQALLQLGFRESLPSAAIPTTWVIDRQGRVAARALSGMTEARLRAMLEPVLAEPTAASPVGSSAASAAESSSGSSSGSAASSSSGAPR